MNTGESGFMQRTSLDAIDGTVRVDKIPRDAPALIAFGGEGARSERIGNYYAGKLYRALVTGGVSGVKIYAALYNIDRNDSRELRHNAFKRAGRKVIAEYRGMIRPTPTTAHIENFYNVAIKPRLFDDDGTRLDTGIATNYIRRLKFFAHCHGATIIQEMAAVMAQQMQAGGYSSDEITQIQRQLLVVQYAPIAPLEKSAFTTISFASSGDRFMQYHSNLFAKYIADMGENTPAAFFGEHAGNIFIAPQINTSPLMEHELEEIADVKNKFQYQFSPDGLVIYTAMYNALTRGAKHSLACGPLPDMKSLTDGDGADFDKLRKNGDAIYAQMLADLRVAKYNHGK